MKFYIVTAHYIEAQESSRWAFTNKRDAVREAKVMCEEVSDYHEWFDAPEVYRVTTNGTVREVMELTAGSMFVGSWELIWESDSDL